MDITGTILFIGETESVGANGFRKRIIGVEEVEGQYPQKLGFEFTQDKTSLLDKFNIGDKVKIHYNLRGNMYQKDFEDPKFFNSLQGWKIENA